VVVDADAEGIRLRITFAGNEGTRLRAGRGIKRPDTIAPISAPTDTDRAHPAVRE